MGTFTVEIEIGDPQGERWERIEALVAVEESAFAAMPTALLNRLGIEPYTRSTFRRPDGHVEERDVGQAPMRIAGREQTQIVVFGEEDRPAVLGMNTLESCLLEPDYEARRLVPKVGLMVTPRLVEKTCRS
jgi:hypothetical protein